MEEMEAEALVELEIEEAERARREERERREKERERREREKAKDGGVTVPSWIQSAFVTPLVTVELPRGGGGGSGGAAAPGEEQRVHHFYSVDELDRWRAARKAANLKVGVARWREQRARCMPQQQEQRPGSPGPEEEGEGRSGCCVC